MSTNRNLNTYISIAATLLLLIGISYLMLQPPGVRRLARETYMAPYPQIRRSNPLPEDTLFEKGMAAYGRKDWNTAITAFNQLDESHPLHQRIVYYMAHAFVGQGQYEKALALFGSPVFQEGQYIKEAEWNKILMMMFLNYPREEIIRQLKVIAYDPDPLINKKAKELLKRMKAK